MWWARPQQIYVGAGRVLVPAAGGGARRESVEQYRCDAGQEEVLVERLLRERPARRTRLFLANGLIRFQSVPRIAGIWRQIERTRAAMRLARLDPAQWEGGGLYAVRAQMGFAWNTFPATTTRYRFGKD